MLASLEKYVSHETLARIEEFTLLIKKWNKVINLVSANDLPELMHRHILDSLQLLLYIKLEDRIIDFGSGGGFPALILSLAGVKEITLIESDSRKIAFLRQAAKLSEQKIEIINERIENIEPKICDIITARAFAELDKIFKLADKNFTVRKKYLLHKGASFQTELAKAQKEWLFDLKLHASLTSAEGKLLEISNLKRV